MPSARRLCLNSRIIRRYSSSSSSSDDERDDIRRRKQTMRESITHWRDAVLLQGIGEHVRALEAYERVEEQSARMSYNMMCACVKLGKIENGIEHLTGAITKDPFLAVAFFQRGALLIKVGRLKDALSDLYQAKMLFRGNSFIDYKPLGLLGRVHLCEVLYNMGLVYLRGKDPDMAMCRLLLTEATQVSVDDTQLKWLQDKLNLIETDKHAAGVLQPKVLSMDRVFCPPKSVTANLATTEVIKPLAKAKVVTATDADDMEKSFSYSKKMKEFKMAVTPNPQRRKYEQQRGRISSDTLGSSLTNARRRSRSTSDLSRIADENSDGLFPQKSEHVRKVSNALVVPGMPVIRPQDGANDAKQKQLPPKSPLVRLKKFIKKKTSFDKTNESLSESEKSPDIAKKTPKLLKTYKSSPNLKRSTTSLSSSSDEDIEQIENNMKNRWLGSKSPLILKTNSSSETQKGIPDSNAIINPGSRDDVTNKTMTTWFISSEPSESNTSSCHESDASSVISVVVDEEGNLESRQEFLFHLQTSSLDSADSGVFLDNQNSKPDTRNINATAIKTKLRPGLPNVLPAPPLISGRSSTQPLDNNDKNTRARVTQTNSEINNNTPFSNKLSKNMFNDQEDATGVKSTTSGGQTAASANKKRPPPPSYPPPPLPEQFVIHV